VTFTQTYNGLVMFREIVKDTLIMDRLDTGFATATKQTTTVSGAGTENPTAGGFDIPQAERGAWIDARLFVPTETSTEKDLVNISDFLNATRFQGVRSQGRINQGASDRLIDVSQFGRSHTAVAWKTSSIYAILNTLGDLTEMEQNEITREFGLLSPRAKINVGKEDADRPDEVWFMGSTGSIYKITPDPSTGQLGVSGLPVSEEMQKTIARINTQVGASTVTFALWSDVLYVAVPLDDATAQGPELVRSQVYSALTYVHTVVPGQFYFWTKGANETQLDNGATTLFDSGEFTAEGGSVTVYAASGTAVTASLKRVFKDVNNTVLIYDFVKGKWAGYDDGPAFTVRDWLKLKVGGEEKLFFIAADGFINYAEALFDDEVAYESFGENLAAGGDETTSTLNFSVTPGRTYIYATEITGGAGTIINGSETITLGTEDGGAFVAQTTTAALNKTSGLWASRAIRLLDWSLEYAAVRHVRTTRAFRCGTLGRKRFPWVQLNVRTFDPNFTLSCMLDGANEEFTLKADRTKDNTRYLKPAGKARWQATNINADHATTYREDYHVELSDAISDGTDIVPGERYYVDSEDAFTAASVTYDGTEYERGETFTGVAGVTTWSVTTGAPVVYPPGSYILPGPDGVVMDLHQQTPEDYRVGKRGQEIQFVLDNAQGRCELVSVAVEGFPVDHRKQSQKG
jgi:hypothetical protein